MTDTLLSDYPASKPEDEADCEPALSAIRTLAPASLDRLADRWLRGHGLRLRERTERRAVPATYAADAAADAGCRLLVRVFQRRNALQGHHLDAFVGALCRSRLASGILVTTGPVAPEALRLAQALRRPRVRLLSGPGWVRELSEAGACVILGSRDAWLLDPACVDAPELGADGPGGSCRSSRRW